MTAFALKFIALIAMVIDHSAIVLRDSLSAPLISGMTCDIMRSVGRMAFPIYAYLLVEGFRHTRSRKKYFLRLLGVGVLSQIPYAFTVNAWLAHAQDAEPFAMFTNLNILFTLALGVLLLTLLDGKQLDSFVQSWGGILMFSVLTIVFYISTIELIAIAFGLTVLCTLVSRFSKKGTYAAGQLARLGLFLLIYWVIQRYTPLRFDYDLMAFLLFAAFYWARSSRLCAAICLVWCVLVYYPEWYLLLGAIVSVILLWLYTGKRGKNDRRLFYWAYPAHLAVLWGVVLLCS